MVRVRARAALRDDPADLRVPLEHLGQHLVGMRSARIRVRVRVLGFGLRGVGLVGSSRGQHEVLAQAAHAGGAAWPGRGVALEIGVE